jgi:hypothetical protein
MLSALASSAMLVASLLAQAEPAPAEPPPPLPAGAPPNAPADPADDAPEPANTISVLARLAERLGSEGTSPGPAAGFSLGLSFQRRYLRLAPRVGLVAAVDFLHDHFAADVQNATPISPVEQPPDAQRVVTQTSFVVLQLVTVDAGPVTAWLGAGAGVTFASFTTPEPAFAPGSLHALQALARGAAGFDVTIARRMAVGVRADVTHPFTHPTLTTTMGQTYSPFGDLFDVGVGFLYRF